MSKEFSGSMYFVKGKPLCKTCRAKYIGNEKITKVEIVPEEPIVSAEVKKPSIKQEIAKAKEPLPESKPEAPESKPAEEPQNAVDDFEF